MRYRSQGVFSLRRWFSRIPTEFPLFRGTWVPHGSPRAFAYRAVTLYGARFHETSADAWVSYCLRNLPSSCMDPLPPQRGKAYTTGFRLFPFARRY